MLRLNVILSDEELTRVVFKSQYGVLYEVKECVVEIQLIWDTISKTEMKKIETLYGKPSDYDEKSFKDMSDWINK